MDNRAAQLKALLLKVAKEVAPESVNEIDPARDSAVDAICEGLVQAFDILMQKPSA